MSYHQIGPVRAHRVDGLGEARIPSGVTLPEDTQVIVEFDSDNVVTATWGMLDSALRRYRLDGLSWTRTRSAPFHHTVKVRLEAPMTRSNVGDAILTVFAHFGGMGAGSVIFRAPYLPADYFTRRASAASGSAPSTASEGPRPVQSQPCVDVGGRCYDYSRPPAGLPPGRWVSGKCVDVEGLQTRCYVPTSAPTTAGGSPRPSPRPTTPDELRMASPPIFGRGAGNGFDPAKAFMVSGLVVLGGVLIYLGWTQWRKRQSMRAAVAKTPARALPRATNGRRRNKRRRHNRGF